MTFCLLPWIMKYIYFQTRVYSKRKEFAPMGANSFLQELTPFEKGGQNEYCKVASSESVVILINAYSDRASLSLMGKCAAGSRHVYLVLFVKSEQQYSREWGRGGRWEVCRQSLKQA